MHDYLPAGGFDQLIGERFVGGLVILLLLLPDLSLARVAQTYQRAKKRSYRSDKNDGLLEC